MKSRFKLLALLCLAVMSLPVFACESATWQGSWHGTLAYRGAPLEIRLHTNETTAGVEALLDIPALVYARQAVAARPISGQSLQISLPFGIGEIRLIRDNESSLSGDRDGFSMQLDCAEPPGHREVPIKFGRPGRELEGTLFLPGEDKDYPVMLLAGGASNASRQSWSYSSWAYTFLDMGVGALVYDRRPDLEKLPGGGMAGIEAHAGDLVSAIETIREIKGVDQDLLGLMGGSRGGWIAMAAAKQVRGLKLMVLSSTAIATPAEAEVTTILTRMRNDESSAESMASARDYLRAYFIAARNPSEWALLSHRIDAAQGSGWFDYVDQPRSIDDLGWWQSNMDFDAIAALASFDKPLLAMWGAEDAISPWAAYKGKLDQLMQKAGNTHYQAHVFDRADHRLEAGFYEDTDGQWHWFGMAPGVLDTMREFVTRHLVTGDRDPED